MRRVVVTGMGIWSCIGQDLQTVTDSLKSGRTGIISDSTRLDFGLHSCVCGNIPKPNLKGLLERKFRINMSQDAEYAYIATKDAFSHADIDEEYLIQNEVGMIWGNTYSVKDAIESFEVMAQEHDSLMVGPNAYYKGEVSGVFANLSSIFHIKGISMCAAAACASSGHAIGLGKMFIENGSQDIILVGGVLDDSPQSAVPMDAWEAISQNRDAATACRPFDCRHDGLIPSGGAAALVLEEYNHAVARGAKILAEIVGYGFSSNGTESIAETNCDGEIRAMRMALRNAGIEPSGIDLVSPHGASTPQGDKQEAIALTKLFGAKQPYIAATKTLTGHELVMAGASEAIYSILMMQNNFVAPNINSVNLIEEAKGLNIPTQMVEASINTVMVNSWGMGGTNSAIVLRKV